MERCIERCINHFSSFSDTEQSWASSAAQQRYAASKPKRLSDEFTTATATAVTADTAATNNNSDTEDNTDNANNNDASANTDVQSMDAIERRDFISEQEACERVSGGSCLLSGNSLIINRTNGDEQRLNLLGNTFSQRVEKIMAAAQELDASDTIDNCNAADGCSRDGSSNNATESANKSLSSTPTSSRRVKRSRLCGPNDAPSSSNELAESSKCLDHAASGSGSALLKDADYSELMLKSKHKRLPFYPNYSNDSSSSDNNNYATDDPTSSNRLEAESSPLTDQPKADANLCPSCTNDAKEGDSVGGEYNEIDAEYEDDDDDDEDIDEEIEEEMAQDDDMEEIQGRFKPFKVAEQSGIEEDLAKPSTSKSSGNAGTSNRSSGCCDCNDDNAQSSTKERTKPDVSLKKRNKTDRFNEQSQYELQLQQMAGGELSGDHASSASTSYRRHTSAATSHDDANGMMNLDAENSTCADWPCESNSDCEEVCTCRDDTDDDINFR